MFKIFRFDKRHSFSFLEIMRFLLVFLHLKLVGFRPLGNVGLRRFDDL